MHRRGGTHDRAGHLVGDAIRNARCLPTSVRSAVLVANWSYVNGWRSHVSTSPVSRILEMQTDDLLLVAALSHKSGVNGFLAVVVATVPAVLAVVAHICSLISDQSSHLKIEAYAPRIGFRPARSPTFQPLTFLPTFATTPAPSWPAQLYDGSVSWPSKSVKCDYRVPKVDIGGTVQRSAERFRLRHDQPLTCPISPVERESAQIVLDGTHDLHTS